MAFRLAVRPWGCQRCFDRHIITPEALGKSTQFFDRCCFRIGNANGYANCTVNLADYIYAYHITSGAAVSLGAVSGGSLATMSGTAWTVGAKNTNTTYAGKISGNSITKVGTGTWTLTGSNYFTGTTTVSAGTLMVNGDNHSAVGAVTVANTATFVAGHSLGEYSALAAAGTFALADAAEKVERGDADALDELSRRVAEARAAAAVLLAKN